MWPFAVVVAYAIAALWAIHADTHGVLYSTEPPAWLRRGRAGWTPVTQFVIAARLYSSLLRWAYVAAGHTGYSHLQLVHALLTYVLLLACCVLLFLGADQCTQEQSLTAAITASVSSSMVVALGRVLFRWGLNVGPRKKVLAQNETARMMGFTEHGDLLKKEVKSRVGAKLREQWRAAKQARHSKA